MTRIVLLALSGLLLSQPAAAMTVREFYRMMNQALPGSSQMIKAMMTQALFNYGKELPDVPQSLKDCVDRSFFAAPVEGQNLPGIDRLVNKVLTVLLEDRADTTNVEELMLESLRETCPLKP